MASKKDLQTEIALLTGRARGAERAAEILRHEIRAHEQRERARQAREHRAEQEKLKAKERQERAKHLDELARGIIRMGDAVESAIVHGGDGAHLELTFRLDGDEARIVGDNLRHGRPRIGEHVSEREGQRITAQYVDELQGFIRGLAGKTRVPTRLLI